METVRWTSSVLQSVIHIDGSTGNNIDNHNVELKYCFYLYVVATTSTLLYALRSTTQNTYKCFVYYIM